MYFKFENAQIQITLNTDKEEQKYHRNIPKRLVDATMLLYLLLLNNNKDASRFAPIFQSTTNYRFSMMLCRSSLTYKPMPINIPLDHFPISMYREFQENGLSLISLSHRGDTDISFKADVT